MLIISKENIILFMAQCAFYICELAMYARFARIRFKPLSKEVKL